MSTFIIKITILVFLFSGSKANCVFSQRGIPEGLEESFRWPGIHEDGSVYFESVAFGLDNAARFFTLPAYKYYKGGFFIWDGNRFEINLGIIKALSNGTLMVVIDEQSRSIMVDSVREMQVPKGKTPGDFFAEMVSKEVGELSIADMGMEALGGQKFRKYKVQSAGKVEASSFFWVDNETKKLKYFADNQEGKLDFYEIRENGPAPRGHSFSVNLPEKEMNDFHGYSVLDLRFLNTK